MQPIPTEVPILDEEYDDEATIIIDEYGNIIVTDSLGRVE
jgi:hypothetical protein